MILGKVKDFFSKGFVSVRDHDTLSKCLPLFKEKMPPVLVVLDSKDEYKGVIARRWIIRSMLDPSKTKVKALMRSAPKVSEEDSLSKTARLMIESGVRQLPVYSGDELLGFITDEDVISGMVIEKWGNMKVEELMTKHLSLIEEEESISSVLNLFRDQDISHAPVVRDGKLVGIISIHDIIEHIYKPKKRVGIDARKEKVKVLSNPLKGIMVRRVITVLPRTTLKTAVEKMKEYNISSLVVVSRSRPVGILTKRDFLEPIAQMEEMERRLTVQFSVKDVEIDEIQRGFIMDEFESFARRFSKTLESGILFVYIKSQGTNYKGDQLVHCRLQLRAMKGSFFSSHEGWGIEQTFTIALDRLEKQVLRSKELDYDPQFAKAYLRLVDFPLSDL